MFKNLVILSVVVYSLYVFKYFVKKITKPVTPVMDYVLYNKKKRYFRSLFKGTK